MNKIYLVVLICISATLHAQFQQTSGPVGGTFRSVTITSGETIYGLTGSGNLFQYADSGWEWFENPGYVDEIFTFHNTLYSLGYDGVFSFDASSQTWTNQFPKRTSNFSLTNNFLYIVSNDTIYKSSDGANFTTAFDSLTVEVEFFGDTLNQQIISISKVIQVDSVYLVAGLGNMAVESRGIFVSHNFGEKWFPPEGLPEFLRVNNFVYHDNKFYVSTNEGAYVSSDLGKTWQPLNEGFTATDSNILLSDLIVQNDHLYTIQNNPYQLFRLSDGMWEPIAQAENTLSVRPYGGDKLLLTKSDGLWLYDVITNDIANLTGNLIASNCHVFALDDDTVLADAGNQKFLTTDGGAHWNVFDHQFEKAMKFSDGLVYTDPDGIHFTNDLWNSTSNLNSNLPSNYLPSISAIVAENGTLYIGFNRTRPRTHLSAVWEAGGVYQSENGGQSWSNINSGLPSQGGVRVPVYNLYAQNDMIIANTLEGTYRKTSETNWTLFENGFTEYEQPIRYEAILDKIVVLTYYGIKYTTSALNQWRDLTAGLDTLYNGYNYHLLSRNGQLYLFSNEEQMFYTLNDTVWQATSLEQSTRFRVNNFSTTENYVYAAVVDGGIWKGDLTTTATGNEISFLPQRLELAQNYPNPFNPETKITYSIPGESKVRLAIYDLRGKEVITLVNRTQNTGKYSVSWNGTNTFGQPVSSGVYFYRLTTGQQSVYKKMLLLK